MAKQKSNVKFLMTKRNEVKAKIAEIDSKLVKFDTTHKTDVNNIKKTESSIQTSV